MKESHDKAHELLLQLIASNSLKIPVGAADEAESQRAKHAVEYLSSLFGGLKLMYEGGAK